MTQPILTIYCAFTRRWAVDQWLDDLAKVDHDPSQTNLAIIVDCDEPYIVDRFRLFADMNGYRRLEIVMNENHAPNEVNIAKRRARIVEVKNQSRELVSKCDGVIVLGFEDDTVFNRLKSLEQLYRPLIMEPIVGFVEGVQMGRWGVRMIGAWKADNPRNPKRIETLLPPGGQFVGSQEITGGGFYGYATWRHLYLNHEYELTNTPWGPDVNYGLYLARIGWKSVIKWGIVFGHNDHGNVGYPDKLLGKQRLAKVIYNKTSTGTWERTDHEPSKY